jgi:hypothetical protein
VVPVEDSSVAGFVVGCDAVVDGLVVDELAVDGVAVDELAVDGMVVDGVVCAVDDDEFDERTVIVGVA